MKRERIFFRRVATVLDVALAGGLSLGLYIVKHGVIELENRLTQVNREIARDQRAIHVLKAEWSFLNEPARVRDLAERHLGMSPAVGGQFGALIALPARLAPLDPPFGPPLDPIPSVASVPIAETKP